MANGETAIEALNAEIEQAIRDIRDRAPTETCQAHDSMSRGVIVLLRCQSAQLRAAQRNLLVTGITAAAIAAIISAIPRIGAVLQALK